jgi:hypothetical protein
VEENEQQPETKTTNNAEHKTQNTQSPQQANTNQPQQQTFRFQFMNPNSNFLFPFAPMQQMQMQGPGQPGNVNNFMQGMFQNLGLAFPPIDFGNLIFGGQQGNFGDYAANQNLQDIINQLFQHDPNRYGTPPASKKAIAALPERKLDAKSIANLKVDECAVCKEKFAVGDVCKTLPCSHDFHPDCLMPWLKDHSNCPLCRHALETDDPLYERKRAAMQQSTSNANTTPNNHSTSNPWATTTTSNLNRNATSNAAVSTNRVNASNSNRTSTQQTNSNGSGSASNANGSSSSSSQSQSGSDNLYE